MNISAIVQHAKESLLVHGSHWPTLLVESDTASTIFILDGFGQPNGTTLDKQKYLFRVGVQFGADHKGSEVKQVCLITEAWASTVKHGEQPISAPSLDPNRREMLMIVVLDVMPTPGGKSHLKQAVHVYEMLRAGTSLDLLAQNKEAEEIESMMLPSFVAGWASTKLSEGQLQDIVARFEG